MTATTNGSRIETAFDEIAELYAERIDREARMLVGFLSQTMNQEPDVPLYIDGQIGWQLSTFLTELVAIAKRHDLQLEVVLGMAARVAGHRHTVWFRSRTAA